MFRMSIFFDVYFFISEFVKEYFLRHIFTSLIFIFMDMFHLLTLELKASRIFIRILWTCYFVVLVLANFFHIEW